MNQKKLKTLLKSGERDKLFTYFFSLYSVSKAFKSIIRAKKRVNGLDLLIIKLKLMER